VKTHLNGFRRVPPLIILSITRVFREIMSDETEHKPAPSKGTSDRERRLANALRANLRKRKDQVRARRKSANSSPEQQDDQD